jgi:predicted nucleic-acid-binding Zn-ribbon protein
MAIASTCIKCGSSSFELGDISIKNANFKLHAVRCVSCGGVVGVVEIENLTDMLFEQNRALKDLASQLSISITLRG